MYAYVYVHAYVEEGGLFGYVIQKSGLQIYCIHTYLKRVDLMYMYFMYFSESSRYLHVLWQ